MSDFRIRPAWAMVGFGGGLLMGILLLTFVAIPAAEKRVRDEAVKANHARYKVVDERGNTKFEWLPAPKTTYKVVDPQGNTEFEDGQKTSLPAPGGAPAKP